MDLTGPQPSYDVGLGTYTTTTGTGFTVTMKVYRVIKNATCILTTTDELKALRKLKELGEARDNSWEWIDTEELE